MRRRPSWRHPRRPAHATGASARLSLSYHDWLPGCSAHSPRKPRRAAEHLAAGGFFSFLSSDGEGELARGVTERLHIITTELVEDRQHRVRHRRFVRRLEVHIAL